jgi:hypothetical protein
MKDEKEFQSEFTAWKRKNRSKYFELQGGAAFELKFKKGFRTRLNIKQSIRPKQTASLLKLRAGGYIDQKLSDLDPKAKPCDCIQLQTSKAYFVFLWYEPRKEKEMFFIYPEEVQKAIETGVKSFTRESARSVASYIHTL